MQNKDLKFIFATIIVNKLQNEQKRSKKDLSFDFDFLDRLVVGIGEVAQITGIPTRQIRYWEDKEIITSLTEEEGKNRRYDYKNIKKMLLIKELLDEGYTLDASAEKVQKRIELIEETLTKLKKGQQLTRVLQNGGVKSKLKLCTS